MSATLRLLSAPHCTTRCRARATSAVLVPQRFCHSSRRFSLEAGARKPLNTQFCRQLQRHPFSRRQSHAVVMVLTESKTMEIGTTAPSFELPEPLTGKEISLRELAQGAPATLVMFGCNHCPFVILLKEGIVSLAKDYQPKGLAMAMTSSNSIATHPQDGPEKMAEDCKRYGYTFPYLYDESQQVAKAYGAVCTPEFFIFDKDLKLAYHGQFDSARPRKDVPVTGEDVRAALDDVLAGKPVQRPIKPSIGCSIKWAPGNE